MLPLQWRQRPKVAGGQAPLPLGFGQDLQELKEMQPDAILFDLETPLPEAAFSLLADCPGLQLIGIDPDRDQVLVWSGQQLHELSVQDLVDVIHRERHGDTGTGRHGDMRSK